MYNNCESTNCSETFCSHSRARGIAGYSKIDYSYYFKAFFIFLMNTIFKTWKNGEKRWCMEDRN